MLKSSKTIDLERQGLELFRGITKYFDSVTGSSEHLRLWSSSLPASARGAPLLLRHPRQGTADLQDVHGCLHATLWASTRPLYDTASPLSISTPNWAERTSREMLSTWVRANPSN